MKITAALLTASLVANAALLGVLVLRPSPAPPAPASAEIPAAAPATAAPTPSSDVLHAALRSGDAAALAAAGVEPEVARDLLLGRSLARLVQRAEAAKESADPRWWRSRGSTMSREQELAAQRELSDALVAAFGHDPLFRRGDENALAFLPPEKRAALRRIQQDYDEMFAKFGAGGIQLPSDRERLRLLREERDRDIAALLTPAERAEYELRSSPATNLVRARYGEAIETEEEFRTLVALQKAFDEKFPREAFSGRVSPELMQQRAVAERQLQEEMRAAVGDAKFAALRRAADFDLRNVDSLVSRLNLPPATTEQVAAARDAYALESQRINASAELTPAQRRDQIQALGARARNDLARTLGAEAADAYAQRSPWVNMLQGGMAFSTNPNDAPGGAGAIGGQSVFPVPPAGRPGGAPMVRQMVNIVTDAAATGGAVGDALFFSAPPTRVENAQVIITRSPDGSAAASSTVVAPPSQGTAPPRP